MHLMLVIGTQLSGSQGLVLSELITKGIGWDFGEKIKA